MGVNLSVRQFREPTLAETVRSALADAGLPASQLELEITEGLLLGHDDHTAALMNELVSGVGVNLAVDDFGTGYSSLAYLKRLPIHRLKIDRAFIRDLVRGGQDEAIVAGVIAIARGLHLDVTAEGVESASQLECLRRLGCGEAQGYFIGRPVPPGGDRGDPARGGDGRLVPVAGSCARRPLPEAGGSTSKSSVRSRLAMASASGGGGATSLRAPRSNQPPVVAIRAASSPSPRRISFTRRKREPSGATPASRRLTLTRSRKRTSRK